MRAVTPSIAHDREAAAVVEVADLEQNVQALPKPNVPSWRSTPNGAMGLQSVEVSGSLRVDHRAPAVLVSERHDVYGWSSVVVVVLQQGVQLFQARLKLRSSPFCRGGGVGAPAATSSSSADGVQLSTASRSRCILVAAARCVASKSSFRSARTRSRVDPGNNVHKEAAPTRNSSTESAQAPSVSVAPDAPSRVVPSFFRETLMSISPPPLQSKSTYFGWPSMCLRAAPGRSPCRPGDEHAAAVGFWIRVAQLRDARLVLWQRRRLHASSCMADVPG